jgi:hypothetical protein
VLEPSVLRRDSVRASAPCSSTDARRECVLPLLSFEDGGTSWTCRFSGWFDLDGGGRTMMNVCRWAY